MVISVKPYWGDEEHGLSIYCGDCIDVMTNLPDNSVDTVITDPPYELSFMGKSWDAQGISFNVDVWAECLRVAKPGAFLLAFGGTRTWHRIAVAIEDAGWMLRDTLCWLYGSGFPKSFAIDKNIDKQAGAEREVVGEYRLTGNALTPTTEKGGTCATNAPNSPPGFIPITTPATPEAQLWEGWGTALKPAFEPIIVAMKPIDDTFANNALTHGVAGLWIDGTRIGNDIVGWGGGNGFRYTHRAASTNGMGTGPPCPVEGRWPPNVILSHADGCKLIGTRKAKGRVINRFVEGMKPFGHGEGCEYKSVSCSDDVIEEWECVDGCPVKELEDQTRYTTDGAGKFFPQFPPDDEAVFMYQAKASRKEKEAGLTGDKKPGGSYEFRNRASGKGQFDGPTNVPVRNPHPTVKPLALMRWLARLTKTPTGGIVLDPFVGSGTTGVACFQEGRQFIGIELAEEYCLVAEQRIVHAITYQPLQQSLDI